MVGQPLTRRSLLGLLAAGGAVVFGAGGFLYAEALVGPARLTARRFVDLLESINGVFPGHRRAHGKGLAVSGWFESNGAGAEISSASVFRPGRHRLVGRFSSGAADPRQPDARGAGRGLGLQFFLPGGEQWRTAMASGPVFLAPTPEAFYEFNAASRPDPATGKPDQAAMAAFLQANPRVAEALRISQEARPASGFATTTFRGLSAFLFVREPGARTPARWSLVPEEAEDGQPDETGPDFLFDGLARRLRRGPLRYRLVLQIGVPGEDPTHDPTQPWPLSRRQIDAGTVVLEQADRATAERVRDANFDPTVLPAGIELSDDPIPRARAAIYAESYRRRSGEAPAPVQRFGGESQ